MKRIEATALDQMLMTAEPIPSPTRTKSLVWVWVWVAFAVQIAAWTTWFTIAANHRVAEVPLATSVNSSP